MQIEQRSRRRSYYANRPKLTYPRGTKGGQYKSRGPYRVNRILPERKNLDYNYPPVPFGVGPWGAPGPTYPQVGDAWAPAGVPNDAWDFYTGNVDGSRIWLLNNISAGTGSTQRIGTRVKIVSLYLQMQVRTWADPNQDSFPCTFRIMAFYDKQPNGQFPNQASSILQPVPVRDQNEIVGPHSPHSLDNRDRFRTLMDIQDTLNPNGDQMRMYEKYIKLNLDVQYSQSGGVPTTNALYLFAVSDMAAVAPDPRPYIRFSSRIRFVDA